MLLTGGPISGLSLAECAAHGCRHRECRAAAAAHARLINVGTRRRLQALIAFEHAPLSLARTLGVSRATILAIVERDATAGPELAAAVRTVYDRLWCVRGGDLAAARMAVARGWPVPLAWDDDPGDPHCIDDPGAIPAPNWRRARRTTHPASVLVEESRELIVMFGYTRRQAADRLGVSVNTLQKATSRHRAMAVAS
jgi:DNA-binding XRE family transcriptional regulator